MINRWILYTLLLCSPLKLMAVVQCTIDNTPILDFGLQDPFTGGTVNTNAQIQWSCSRGFFENTSFKMCIYLAADGTGSIIPRNMSPAGGGGPSIPFNAFTSPTGPTVVQPSTNALEVSVDMAGFFQFNDSGTVNIFGIAPGPLPANVRAEVHNALMTNSQVTRIGNNQSCNTTTGSTLTTYTLEATMEIQDQCQFTANDLDFGTQSTPLAQTDADTFIDVRCTNTTPFTVGLNEGNNFAAGSRRMSDGTNFVDYGLFQNAARSTEWDNTSNRRSGTGLGTGSSIMMTVFGRIPADPTAVQGTYSDTVTVDIVF